MPTLIIDDRTVHVPDNATVLQAVQRAGIHLPTLCYWEGLPPYGACRLCMVELTAPRRQTIPACSYPAADGMVIETHGPRAVAIRKLMLEFMLARCPSSDVIRALAAEEGMTEARFQVDDLVAGSPPNPLCILCGLCVRVCQDLVGAAALGFVGRGAERQVGTPFLTQSDACIGCGACAAVCPTGAVHIEDVDGQRILHTWNTTVPLHACPSCGRPFTPEPMAFLREHVAAQGLDIEPVWGLCPACRRKQTAIG